MVNTRSNYSFMLYGTSPLMKVDSIRRSVIKAALRQATQGLAAGVVSRVKLSRNDTGGVEQVRLAKQTGSASRHSLGAYWDALLLQP